MSSGPVVVLAGGSGGAKLARGMLDLVGDDLVVVANTGDDIEIYGALVSPDPDLISFTLADLIDDRGWGIEGDSFRVMDALRAHGSQIWFKLGDRDLAWCIERRRLIEGGATATEALASLTGAIGLRARVLPACDEPLRTEVRARGEWFGLQQFLIVEQGRGPVDEVRIGGIDAARPTAAVLEALGSARAIIIGPSNPIISIGPIIEIPGMRDAIINSPAAVVAVSPIVGGKVLKGPTAAMLESAGLSVDGAGIARAYQGLIDGLVSDLGADLPAVELTVAPTLIDSPATRLELARTALIACNALSL